MVAQAQSHPPLVVRVNTRSISAPAYAEQLNAAGMEARVIGQQAVLLAKPVPVSALHLLPPTPTVALYLHLDLRHHGSASHLDQNV